jgi:hypothetical protein
VSIGCPIALRNLQSASVRMQLISGYPTSWWVNRNHKDAMARFRQIILSIVSMNNDQVIKKAKGSENARIAYHHKWDVFEISLDVNFDEITP